MFTPNLPSSSRSLQGMCCFDKLFEALRLAIHIVATSSGAPLNISKGCLPRPSAHGVLPSFVIATSASEIAEDKWIARTLKSLEPQSPAPQLDRLRSSCLGALSTMRMPSTRNEEYRYTDINPILANIPQRSLNSLDSNTISEVQQSHSLKSETAATITVLNGVVHGIASKVENIYIGTLSNAPEYMVSMALGSQSRSRGGAFATLNGATATDCLVICVPAHVHLEAPIHIIHIATGSASPRVLILLEECASAEIIEEYIGLPDQSQTHLTNAVAEIELDDGASLKHRYVEMESDKSYHIKSTLVAQGSDSSYELVEARLGGDLSRHDINVEQLGPKTHTVMKHFLLSGNDQLHDLHSKLDLKHPQGEATQLHKCIAAAASARGVFDGNVRVGRLAQKTDAGQLSRNLLLVPKATVNVKPNLQIIADDVKCTHGCTVSDLSEEELFYLRARGIDPNTARRMLVYSFGQEVVRELNDDLLVARVEEGVKSTLKKSIASIL